MCQKDRVSDDLIQIMCTCFLRRSYSQQSRILFPTGTVSDIAMHCYNADECPCITLIQARVLETPYLQIPSKVKWRRCLLLLNLSEIAYRNGTLTPLVAYCSSTSSWREHVSRVGLVLQATCSWCCKLVLQK